MKTRRRFTAEFKAKVSLEAIRGERTISELATKYQLHPNQITQWKTQLLEGASGVFLTPTEKREAGAGPSVKDMQAKIGQLALENDFLAGALGRVDGASAKK